MSSINLSLLFKRQIIDKTSDYLAKHSSLKNPDSVFKFEIPPDTKMGHLALACFPLASLLKKAPQKIASDLAEIWGKDPLFSDVKPVGPYLNFFIKGNYLAEQLLKTDLVETGYGKGSLGRGKKIMIEFSSPNTNKPLHLGHGRNNLLGDVLSKLFLWCGYDVIRANLINDRGIHICKSMLAYQKWSKGEDPGSSGKKGDKLVGDYYVLYDQKSKENPELALEASQMLRDWEQGKEDVISLWKKMNGWVLNGFQESYQRMGIVFDQYYYESETYKGGREVIQAKLKEGVCQLEENGAISIDLEKEKLGTKILLRSDGTSMYITQDIQTTLTKFKDYPLERCFFVVGNEQDNHFRILFEVLKKFGYSWADHLEHISYGMITLPEGKMKSREGTVVDLDELMDEMANLALEEIKSRRTETGSGEGEEDEQTAEAIGQAAIRFYILRTGALKEIQFNPRESLSFDGMTGPYLQYTHARICSLFRKLDRQLDQEIDDEYPWQPDEITLMVQLSRFPDIVLQGAQDRNPAVLCGYLYDLCRSFNKYYYDNPIIKAKDESTVLGRVKLSGATRSVLARGLEILGIKALERM